MSERRLLLLYSTSHIRLADSELLDKHAEGDETVPEWPCSNTNWIAGHDFGWLIWTGTGGPDPDAAREFAAAGFSPAVLAVLRHAHARGAEYVMFDADAVADDDLEEFDWAEEKRGRDGTHSDSAQVVTAAGDPSLSGR